MVKVNPIIIGVIFFFLAISSVSAIGIGPPRIEIDFVPNLEQSFEYTILNNINSASQIDIYAKGDLAQYVTFDKDSFTLNSQQSTKITAFLKLPAEIEVPGIHDLRIGALASPAGSGSGTVGAKAGVESQLNIFVPYQGKYLTTTFEATSVKLGETVDFTISLSNKGLEDINKVSSSIEIYQEDRLVGTTQTNEKPIKANVQDTLEATWSTSETSAGEYKAIATIDYDGNTKEVETIFSVGEPLAEISDVIISDFKKGGIAKITITGKSYWNEPLSEVYATIDVYDSENNILESAESNKKEIGPLSTVDIEVFLDTAELGTGDYNSKATFHYLGKTADKSFILTVEKGKTFLIVTLSILSILVILFAYLMWTWLAKK